MTEFSRQQSKLTVLIVNNFTNEHTTELFTFVFTRRSIEISLRTIVNVFLIRKCWVRIFPPCQGSDETQNGTISSLHCRSLIGQFELKFQKILDFDWSTRDSNRIQRLLTVYMAPDTFKYSDLCYHDPYFNMIQY